MAERNLRQNNHTKNVYSSKPNHLHDCARQYLDSTSPSKATMPEDGLDNKRNNSLPFQREDEIFGDEERDEGYLINRPHRQTFPNPVETIEIMCNSANNEDFEFEDDVDSKRHKVSYQDETSRMELMEEVNTL